MNNGQQRLITFVPNRCYRVHFGWRNRSAMDQTCIFHHTWTFCDLFSSCSFFLFPFLEILSVFLPVIFVVSLHKFAVSFFFSYVLGSIQGIPEGGQGRVPFTSVVVQPINTDCTKFLQGKHHVVVQCMARWMKCPLPPPWPGPPSPWPGPPCLDPPGKDLH